MNPETEGPITVSSTTDTQADSPELSLRERALRAIDEKIMEDPFYTGVNSEMWGLSTPITRSRYDIPKTGVFVSEWDDISNDPSEMSSTPEGLAAEIDVEIEQQEGQEPDEYAQEMFEGTTVVLNDNKERTPRKNGTGGISWRKQQKNWARDWEITGAYYGTAAIYEEIGGRFHITKQAVDQAVKRNRAEIVSSPNTKDQKPVGLWNRRAEIFDPESEFYELIDDLEKGMDNQVLSDKYGNKKLSKYRGLFSELGVDVHILHARKWYDAEFSTQFESLSDPDLSVERKTEIVSKIDINLLRRHSEEELHVRGISNQARENGLFFDVRDIKRIIEALGTDEDIVVHSIPHILKGKIDGYYRILPEGDVERASRIFRESESLTDLRVPAVVGYGLAEGSGVNTTELVKGRKRGEYKRANAVLGKVLSTAIRDGQIDYSDICGEDMPGGMWVGRSGAVYIRPEDEETLRDYFSKKTEEIMSRPKHDG